MISVNEKIIKERLDHLIKSKRQNDIKIKELEEKAKILRKQLQIETD